MISYPAPWLISAIVAIHALLLMCGGKRRVLIADRRRAHLTATIRQLLSQRQRDNAFTRVVRQAAADVGDMRRAFPEADRVAAAEEGLNDRNVGEIAEHGLLERCAHAGAHYALDERAADFDLNER